MAPQRIASVKGRDYVLVKNDESKGIGHIMRLAPAESARIVEEGRIVGKTSHQSHANAYRNRYDDDEKNENENEDDVEFVEVQPDKELVASIDLADFSDEDDELNRALAESAAEAALRLEMGEQHHKPDNEDVRSNSPLFSDSDDDSRDEDDQAASRTKRLPHIQNVRASSAAITTDSARIEGISLLIEEDVSNSHISPAVTVEQNTFYEREQDCLNMRDEPHLTLSSSSSISDEYQDSSTINREWNDVYIDAMDDPVSVEDSANTDTFRPVELSDEANLREYLNYQFGCIPPLMFKYFPDFQLETTDTLLSKQLDDLLGQRDRIIRRHMKLPDTDESSGSISVCFTFIQNLLDTLINFRLKIVSRSTERNNGGRCSIINELAWFKQL